MYQRFIFKWAKYYIFGLQHFGSYLFPQLLIKIKIFRQFSRDVALDKLAKGKVAVELLRPTQVHLKHTLLLHVIPIILTLHLNNIIVHLSLVLCNLLQKSTSVVLKASKDKFNCYVRLNKVQMWKQFVVKLRLAHLAFRQEGIFDQIQFLS